MRLLKRKQSKKKKKTDKGTNNHIHICVSANQADRIEKQTVGLS